MGGFMARILAKRPAGAFGLASKIIRGYLDNGRPVGPPAVI